MADGLRVIHQRIACPSCSRRYLRGSEGAVFVLTFGSCRRCQQVLTTEALCLRLNHATDNRTQLGENDDV